MFKQCWIIVSEFGISQWAKKLRVRKSWDIFVICQISFWINSLIITELGLRNKYCFFFGGGGQGWVELCHSFAFWCALLLLLFAEFIVMRMSLGKTLWIFSKPLILFKWFHWMCIKQSWGGATMTYRQLRARRALFQIKDVLLRTRRALLPLTLYSNSALLVLNGKHLELQYRPSGSQLKIYEIFCLENSLMYLND